MYSSLSPHSKRHSSERTRTKSANAPRPYRRCSAAMTSTPTLAMAWSVVTWTPVPVSRCERDQRQQYERAEADEHAAGGHDGLPALEDLDNLRLVVVCFPAVAERLRFLGVGTHSNLRSSRCSRVPSSP